MPYEPRTYRQQSARSGLTYFSVSWLETDLWIGVDTGAFFAELPEQVRQEIMLLRQQLNRYISEQPEFLHSFSPVRLLPSAPEIARLMADAAAPAGVGPMAAVAGAFAETIGKSLIRRTSAREVIVENGGDIYLHTQTEALIGVCAGDSPLSQQLALRIPPGQMPLGVCTSAGTVGPSVSLGKTDATVTLAASAAQADAYASTLGNLVQTADDIPAALAVAPTLPDLLGCVIILGDQLGAWGQVELAPMSRP